MTYSIGFRSPRAHELAGELLQRLAQEADDQNDGRLYNDRHQPAQAQPAKIPDQLVAFASDALSQMLNDRVLVAKCLGEHLTEPKPNVWFQAPDTADRLFDLKGVACQLDRRTRMMYDRISCTSTARVTGQGARCCHAIPSGRSAHVVWARHGSVERQGAGTGA